MSLYRNSKGQLLWSVGIDISMALYKCDVVSKGYALALCRQPSTAVKQISSCDWSTRTTTLV